MLIDLPAPIIETYVQAEYDSEILDDIVNRFYLGERYPKEDVVTLLKAMTPSNAYRRLVLSKMNLEEKETFSMVAFGFGLDEINPTEIKEIETNPYYLLLKKMPSWKEGNVEFISKEIPAYSLFLSLDKGIDEMIPSQEKTYLSYLEKDVSIPTLLQDDLVWMSLVPHEIHTMAKPIEEAKGDVLVYGVGLGYYAFMVSNKKDVSSVTIIEKDPRILALFKKHFLPLFPNVSKIHLIQGDALAYQKRRDVHYDYCFVDIYRGERDGFPLYASLKANEGNADQYSYWIEGALLVYLRRHICVLLEEVCLQGYTEDDYKDESDETSKLLKRLYFACQDVNIQNENDLRYFLSNQNLQQLVAKLKY